MWHVEDDVTTEIRVIQELEQGSRCCAPQYDVPIDLITLDFSCVTDVFLSDPFTQRLAHNTDEAEAREWIKLSKRSN